ncbi:MAG: hypothetical protein ACMUEL_02205 [Flavobacteriales bacterium Tduv]
MQHSQDIETENSTNFHYLCILSTESSMCFFLKMSLITILLLIAAVMGIGIKLWSKRGGKFSGTCSSQNPFLNESGEACTLCKRGYKTYENRD